MVDFQYVFHRARQSPRGCLPAGSHQHSFSQGLPFFSASCAPSRGGCCQLSRTPPTAPTTASQCPTGPAFRRFPAGPAQSSGLPQRPSSFFGKIPALLLPAPQGRFEPLPPRNGGAPCRGESTPRWRWRSGGTGQPLPTVMPPSFRASSLSNRMRAWVCLYRCCPSLGNQGLQGCRRAVLPWSIRRSVFLVRHDASPWMQFANVPTEYTARASIQRRWPLLVYML